MRLVATLSAFGLMLLGFSSDTDGLVRGHAVGPPARGLEVRLTVAEMMDASDLVVRGEPIGRTTVRKRPATTSDYPEHLKLRHAHLIQELEKVSFRVEEYYKGDGPQVIPVTVEPSILTLEQGTAYVLFLFQPATAEGRAYFDQGFLIHGFQGLWTVKGDTVIRGPRGGETTLRLSYLSRLNWSLRFRFLKGVPFPIWVTVH